MTCNSLLIYGHIRGKKGVLNEQIAALPVWTGPEIDALERKKHGTPSIDNPDVDFPAVSKLTMARPAGGRPVVLEESFVEKSNALMPARWVGFDCVVLNTARVWHEPITGEAFQQKPIPNSYQSDSARGTRAIFTDGLHQTRWQLSMQGLHKGKTSSRSESTQPSGRDSRFL